MASHTVKRAVVLVVIGMVVGARALGKGAPSGAVHDGRDARLDTRIQLQALPTTMRDLAKALSSQTGMDIRAVDWLGDRLVTPVVSRASLSTFLDALCELEEWTWSQPKPGAILIERKRPALPRNFSEVGTRLFNALQPDVRRFLGVGVQPEDVLGEKPLVGYRFDNAGERLRYEVGVKITTLRDEAQFAFYESLKPGILDGAKLPVVKLDDSARRRLVEILCLHALSDLNLDLLAGVAASYEQRPDQCYLRLTAGPELHLATRHREGDQIVTEGFSAPLTPPRVIAPQVSGTKP